MRTVILLFSLLATACAGVGGPDAEGSLVIEAAHGVAALEGRLVVTVSGTPPTLVEVPVAELTTRVKWGPIDGTLESLVIPLGDIDVSPARFPPNGLQLKEVTLQLPATAHGSGQRTSDVSMKLDVVTPLRLTMGLGLEGGGTYDLGPTTTAPVHIHVEADSTSVRVKADCRGVCWKIGGIAEMSDAMADVSSSAQVVD